MADHFEFRSTKPDPEELYYEYKLDGVMISSYNVGGSSDSAKQRASDDFASKSESDTESNTDFTDDFLF